MPNGVPETLGPANFTPAADVYVKEARRDVADKMGSVPEWVKL